VPRIFRKSSGAWGREWEPRAKVGGAWKRVGKVWTKQSGTWKPTFWAPEVGVSCDYGRIQADPYHWFYADIEVKYLGGDPLDGASWSMRMYYQEYQGTHTNSHATNTPSGWQTGAAGGVNIYNGPIYCHDLDAGTGTRTINLYVRVGGMDYDDGGSYAASHGSFMPVVHLYSAQGYYGNHVWHRKGFDNANQLDHFIRGVTSPYNYSLT
tara:strand:+ start:3277 stop:3903 length:627 start_codon:yes stop_codon:yes gene_type:complete